MTFRNWLFLAGFSGLLAACVQDTEPTEAPSTCNGGKCDIIGEDDRKEEYSGDITERMRVMARSTAMVVANESITDDGTTTTFNSQRLGDAYMMCPDERLADQPVTGFCSAWLVAPDVMVTNGHCIKSQQACQTSSFVFDYALTEESSWLDRVPSRQVYACDQVLAWDYTRECDVDFAIVRLKRPVDDRDPLDVRPSGDALDANNLVIIGHPFGVPRKYALNGKLTAEGSNTFTTTHDIFGGNSGSAIFDAETGEVQGLVTCGGSTLDWVYYNQGWTLDRKTGKNCNTSCDDAGTYTEGTWESCADGQRRRCACVDEQLVWEKRSCLSFEEETQGQCSREAVYSEFTCETAPWLCPTPLAQHTKHFAHYTDRWEVFSSSDPITPESLGNAQSTIVIDRPGVAQAITVFLDFVGDQAVESVPLQDIERDHEITLSHGNQTYTLIGPDGAASGTASPVNQSPGAVLALQVPFALHEAQLKEVAGDWTLNVIHKSGTPAELKRWSIQTIIKPLSQITDTGLRPCVSDCISSHSSGPETVIEAFDGASVDLQTDNVSGTLTAGWETEVLDSSQQYEVFKTRRSQTMSLTTGEFALVKDFGADIGGRELTLDYRYDGDGWFHVYADNHLLLSRESFSQTKDSVVIPVNARQIRMVLGATNNSRAHELTLYRLELKQGPPATP